VVLRIEAAFGQPQDVEWAFEDARLFVLQARPITSRLLTPAIDDPARLVFDNSNIVESYPGLVTPLTYSFAGYVYARVYRMFVRLVGVDEAAIRAHAAAFDNMLARVDGRVYYNLVNWYRALALLPGFALNRSYMEQMMGVASPLPPEIADNLLPRNATGLARLREWSRIARVAVRLAVAALRLNGSIARFHKRLARALERPAAELAAMPLSALAAEYRRIEADLLDRWDAPLVNDFLCMMAFGASRKLMERWAGAGGLALHNDIMIGQGDIISAEPARRIARMGALAAGDSVLVERLAVGWRHAMEGASELAAEIRAYIAKFGDRCTEELKLESRTLEEHPAPLLAAIAAAARVPSRRAAVQSDGLERLAALLADRPLKRFVALRLVGWAKRRVRDRENLRFERTRIFGRARRLFLAIGAQLAALGLIPSERDVFFLTVQEVLGAIEGSGLSADLGALVRLRKAEQEAAATRPDPPERLEMRGAAAASLVQRQAATPAVTSDDKTRQGTGCSAGSVVARARVVRDPSRESLSPGEILVARHTDPGWIAVFSSAAAIVVERGSLLSHSAIVARELGIPCVVGLKGATEWIATGDLLEVDGATGLVGKRP
jgi:phosphohistidine swiveling domain-containing protein